MTPAGTTAALAGSVAAFPHTALMTYMTGLMQWRAAVIDTLRKHVVPELPRLAAERERRDAWHARTDSSLGASRMRIAIVGGPGTGKTTLATQLARVHGLDVLHSDALIGLGWSDASASLASLVTQMHQGIIEGVAVPRALRKALLLSGERPVELVVRLTQPLEAQTEAQRAMHREHDRVLADIRPALEARGVRFLEDAISSLTLARLERARLDAGDTPAAAIARAQRALDFDIAPFARRAGLRAIEQAAETLQAQLSEAWGVPVTPRDMLAMRAGARARERQSRQDARKSGRRKSGPRKPMQDTIPVINPFVRESGIAGRLEAFVQQQVKRTKSMTDEVHRQAQKIVREGLEQGMRPDLLASTLVSRVSGITAEQATVVANHAVGTLHAKSAELMQTDLGVTEYTWATAGDIKVRPGHRALEGTRQKWDSPPVVDPKTGKRAHPGFDTHYYACRCTAEPVIDIKTMTPPAASPLARPRPVTGTGQQPLFPPTQPAPRPVRGTIPTPPVPPPAAPTLPPVPPPPAPPPPSPPPPPVPVPPVPVAPPPPPPPPPPPTLPAPAPPAPPPVLPAPAPPTRAAPPRFTPPPLADAAATRRALALGEAEMAPLGKGEVFRDTPVSALRAELRDMLTRLGYAGRSLSSKSTVMSVARNLGRGILGMRSAITDQITIAANKARATRAALKRMTKGEGLTKNEDVDAIETLVHEALHGYGTRSDVAMRHQNLNLFRFVEESTTEIVARDTTRTLVGQTGSLPGYHPLELPQVAAGLPTFTPMARSYDEYIATLLHHVRDVTGWTPPQTLDAVRAAAHAVKRSTATVTSPEAYLRELLAALPTTTPAEQTVLYDRLKDPRVAIQARAFAASKPRTPPSTPTP